MKGISFCIPTNGAKAEKTLAMLKSIDRQIDQTLPMEVILCGDVSKFESVQLNNVWSMTRNEAENAHNGMLARLRNLAADYSTYDVLVFVDDDFIFPKTWTKRFLQFSKENLWQICFNRILLPCGGRFWDRAITKPHSLVSYDYSDTDPNLYQTGGFWIIKKELFEEEKWLDELPINATKHGFEKNEDLDMSLRMHARNIPFTFDKKNFVWHWDTSYAQKGKVTVKRKNYPNLAKFTILPSFTHYIMELLDE